jgi:uncharacterized membrane protein SirB2
MGIFLVTAFVFIGIGLLVRRSQKWKQDIAVVFLSTSAFIVFTLFTMACSFSSPEIVKLLPQKSPLGSFNDYFTGITCIVIFICVGLIFLSRAKNSETGG